MAGAIYEPELRGVVLVNQICEWAEVDTDFFHSEGPARSNIFLRGIGALYPENDAAIDEAKGITDPPSRPPGRAMRSA